MFHSSTFFSAAPLVANGASSDLNKGKEKEIDDGGSMREEIPDKVDGSTQLIQVMTLKKIDVINEFTSAGLHGVFLSFYIYTWIMNCVQLMLVCLCLLSHVFFMFILLTPNLA